MNTTECQCFESDTHIEWTDQGDIGMTADYWDITHMRCATCGTPWLRAFFEIEAFARSSRHYRVPTTDAKLSGITPDAALLLIETAPFRIVGGSYYDGKEHRT